MPDLLPDPSQPVVDLTSEPVVDLTAAPSSPAPLVPSQPLSWGFTASADLASRTLRLVFSGDDPLAFGLPGQSRPTVVLEAAAATSRTLPGGLVDRRTIEVALPADLPVGWWDITLILSDPVTGLERTARQYGVAFGDVTRAVLSLDPPTEVRFGDHVTLRLVEPVGRTLAQIGMTPERVVPVLRRADTGYAAPATLIGFDDRSLRFALPARYATYDSLQPDHRLDPGFTGFPLSVLPQALPLLRVLPLQLTTAVVASVLQQAVRATVPQAELRPGVPAVWDLAQVPREQLVPPAGMTSAVFDEVVRLLVDSGGSFVLHCSLALQGSMDATGALPAAQRTSASTSPGSLRGLVRRVDLGLLRPRVVPLLQAWPGPQAGTTATLRVELEARLADPVVYSGTVRVTLPATAVPTLVQLPLPVPRAAVLFDGRYDGAGRLPEGGALVLLPDSGLDVANLAADAEVARQPLRLVADALDLLEQALPRLGPVFPGLPGLQSLGSLSTLASWLRNLPKAVVVGRPSTSDLSALGRHPEQEDDASSLFLVGLPGRVLRLFADRSTDASRTPYLDAAVPSGHLVASCWTLHESLFQDGFGPRAPFRAVTVPSPKQQYDAARSTGRPDMPSWPFTGASFGNVLSAFAWL